MLADDLNFASVQTYWNRHPEGDSKTFVDNFLKNDKFRTTYGLPVPIFFYPKTLHRGLIKYFQPKTIDGLVEVPDTGLFSDYTSVKLMKERINEAVKLSSTKDIYISLGFHMDTAQNLLDRLMEALDYANSNHGGRIEYKKVSEIT